MRQTLPRVEPRAEPKYRQRQRTCKRINFQPEGTLIEGPPYGQQYAAGHPVGRTTKCEAFHKLITWSSVLPKNKAAGCALANPYLAKPRPLNGHWWSCKSSRHWSMKGISICICMHAASCLRRRRPIRAYGNSAPPSGDVRECRRIASAPISTNTRRRNGSADMPRDRPDGFFLI